MAPRACPLTIAGLLLCGLAVAALASAPLRSTPQPLARGHGTATGPHAPDAAVAESPAARALREGEPIDLNRASARDLQLLPGIGPKLAARVTRNRRQAGPFENVEDMARVRGIGPKTIARLKSLVRTPVDASVAGDQTADAGAPGP